jgi:uncharacterized protein
MARIGLAALLLLLIAPALQGAVRYPPRPPQGESVLDEAGMLRAGDAEAVRSLGAALLRDKGFPLVVVTIESLAAYDAAGTQIETYARGLFDSWGVGRPEHNYGILLLIAREDRRARIELGAAWGREHDAVCRDVMDTLIIPNFKKGLFSEGITAGAQGLDKMARGEAIPSRPIGERAADSASSAVAWLKRNLGFALLIPFFIVSAIYNRLRYGMWTNPNRSDDGGGGWGGGSFGGGFSGGGGASGSW